MENETSGWTFDWRYTDSPEQTLESIATLEGVPFSFHDISTRQETWTDLLDRGKPVGIDAKTLAEVRALIGKPKLRWTYKRAGAPIENTFVGLLISAPIDQALELSRTVKVGSFLGGKGRPTGVTCKSGPNGTRTFAVAAEASIDGATSEGSNSVTFNRAGQLVGAAANGSTSVDGAVRSNASGTSSFQYIPVTITRPTTDTFVPKTQFDRALAGVRVRRDVAAAATTTVKSSNLDGRATPVEVRSFARKACRATDGLKAPCSVTWISRGARISAADPYKGGRYVADVVVKKGKAVRT
jgi:hypothetical protein